MAWAGSFGGGLFTDVSAFALDGRLGATVVPALNAAIAIVIGAQVGLLGWRLSADIGPIGPPAAIVAKSAAADLSVLTRFDPFFSGTDAAGPATGDAGLVLFAVRAGGADGGGAIILLPDRGQRAFSVGDQIVPGVTLKAVGADFVTLEREGVETQLRFPAGATAPPPPASETAQPIDPGDATLRVATTIAPADFMAGLALQARFENGEVTGYALQPQRPVGPALARLGLRPGDVLLAVNSLRLIDDERLNELQGELASRPEAVIRYERDGSVRTATARIATQ